MSLSMCQKMLKSIGVAMSLKVPNLKLSGMQSLLNMRRNTVRKLQSWRLFYWWITSWLGESTSHTPRKPGWCYKKSVSAKSKCPCEGSSWSAWWECGSGLSNMTLLKSYGDFQKGTPEERNVRFGVREHGMGAICNGIALHSPGFIPYCATSLSHWLHESCHKDFALSESGVIYVMTHDSIGLGEDGPTHQPIEHLASFRAMPNILMLRPADGNETAGSYKVAVLNRKRPSILALSRQKLAQLPGTSIEGVEKGWLHHFRHSSGNKPDVILIGTGSELEIAAAAADDLRKEGKAVRVVSLLAGNFWWAVRWIQGECSPCSVTARVSIEAGSTFGWGKIVGSKGKAIGIDRLEQVLQQEKYTRSLVSPRKLLLLLPKNFVDLFVEFFISSKTCGFTGGLGWFYLFVFEMPL